MRCLEQKRSRFCVIEVADRNIEPVRILTAD